MVGAIIGNYHIIRKIGAGGMGVVYLGQHALLGRRAAIKVLLPALSVRPDVVSRFFNEARAVTSINDPGIVQVFDFGYHTDGSAYIVMEFLEGEPLDRRLARLGSFPVHEALRLCRQIASSLAAAHAKNITHRDLKPENIFLVHDGEVASGERSKILDFGIAKLSDEHPGKVKTSTGALMGTPMYMSPEQCRGLANLDHRSDIYSLGCVMFHLMTGRPPFDGEGMGDIIVAHIREPAPAPSSRIPEIESNVDALVLRCLVKAPADRFQSMTELATAIGQLLPCITFLDRPIQYMLAYQVGSPPSPYPSRSQPQAALSAPELRTSTTLSASAGLLPRPSMSAPAVPSKQRWWVAGVVVLGATAAAIAVVSTHNDGSAHIASTAHDGSLATIPTTPDAAVAATSPVIDADVEVLLDAASHRTASTPDIATDVPDVPFDAAVNRSPHPYSTAPQANSGTTNTPTGCDRTIDTDCDGIPDVR